MKITEIIIEAKGGKLSNEQSSVMNSVSTFPNQNMYHGSGYLHSRMLLALAGAGAGDTPDENMGEMPWEAGDPVFAPYHPAEDEMLERAAKHIGDTSQKSYTSKRSTEPDSIQKHSPVQARGPIALKSKKSK